MEFVTTPNYHCFCVTGESYQINDQEATYYISFLVVEWADIFSHQIYRDAVIDSLKFCRLRKGMELNAYGIMTNHVHVTMASKTGKLSDLVRDYKKLLLYNNHLFRIHTYTINNH
jgi:REP element-mobilizing transposase RayT